MALSAFGDGAPYNEVARIWAESEELIALHYHDWTDWRALAPIFDDVGRRDRYFTDVNRLAYIELRDKKSGRKLWRRPCPAMTYLWISPDGHYIVGLSKVKISNPYQLVIFNIKGTLLLREHVVATKAALSETELKAFLEKYPDTKRILTPRTKLLGSTNYVDFLDMGMPNAIPEEAWRELYDKQVSNLEFPCASESVTNWVEWFLDPPEPGIVQEKGRTYFEFNSLCRVPLGDGSSIIRRVRVEIPNRVPVTD